MHRKKPTKTARPARPTWPPGEDLDLRDPKTVCQLFEQAAQANLSSTCRQGCVDVLPAHHRLLITGDLHDHGLNFQRIAKIAALEKNAQRHVVLHELIHGPHRVAGKDLSLRTLMRAAALKIAYPDQVHLMLGNHEVAQLGNQGISKNGVNVVTAFNQGIEYMFGDDSAQVNAACKVFIRSFLLAVRCPNGIMVCHSLPSNRHCESFDDTVFDRIPTQADLAFQGSAYNMVWGRNHSQALGQHYAKRWQVQRFVMGHQVADMGYDIQSPDMLIIASDHAHGMALPIQTSKQYNTDQLVSALIPLASVTLSA